MLNLRRSGKQLGQEYLSYEPNDSYFYLNRTARWAGFLASQLTRSADDEF